MIYLTIVGGAKYEFIIVVYGDKCLIQISRLPQFIYLFHIIVFNVLCEYTLSRCVPEEVR